MQNLREQVAALNDLVAQYRYPEAFDRFYDESVLNYENELPPLVGLAAEREAMTNFLTAVADQPHTAELKNVLVADDVSVSEWLYDFTHKDWGKRRYTQITVQRWKGGRVIHQRHHYATN
ncbi:nuclear transport factor 2 family protein [Fibrisoma montanum]|uniref:Nuclear transport factor 2 family protein n=1 Tax=Fibrisoma montanum TaxID=2305895 RepID=A0A418M225_9BACT|nr:nuclear transport factor 2 family protein [Fibrisoma montanum]RIV19793.1 nuclear transport factor 2 family protein [Fibrisoma montanum]